MHGGIICTDAVLCMKPNCHALTSCKMLIIAGEILISNTFFAYSSHDDLHACTGLKTYKNADADN